MGWGGGGGRNWYRTVCAEIAEYILPSRIFLVALRSFLLRLLASLQLFSLYEGTGTYLSLPVPVPILGLLIGRLAARSGTQGN
jgi:hypothetical protein